jgi:catechol 2,3-dioxygenase-like lactoylglutathione lyase family enzyme
MSKKSTGLAALFVPDYDTAISYYTQTLGFVLIADEKIAQDKRWAIIKPYEHAEFGLLLGKANGLRNINPSDNKPEVRFAYFFMLTILKARIRRSKSVPSFFLEHPQN